MMPSFWVYCLVYASVHCSINALLFVKSSFSTDPCWLDLKLVQVVMAFVSWALHGKMSSIHPSSTSSLRSLMQILSGWISCRLLRYSFFSNSWICCCASCLHLELLRRRISSSIVEVFLLPSYSWLAGILASVHRSSASECSNSY